MKSSYFENLLVKNFLNILQDQFLSPVKEELEFESQEEKILGSTIPIVFGTTKVAGKILFTYSDNKNKDKFIIVVAICQGPLKKITEIKRDDQNLTINNDLEISLGSETQNRNSILQEKFGDNVPAFRNLAYVVFRNQNKANAKFEFIVEAMQPNKNATDLEHQIQNIVLEPVGGEGIFSWQKMNVQKIPNGIWESINNNIDKNKSDLEVSIENLSNILPNVKNNNWVLIKIPCFIKSISTTNQIINNQNYFNKAGTTVEIAIVDSTVKAGTEFANTTTSNPDWGVGGFNRNSAYQIPKINNKLNFGGTPDDDVLLECLKQLKDKGYKILLSPVLQVLDKPNIWRGYIKPSNINNFFQNTDSDNYNKFIHHYATLSNNKHNIHDLIHAFAIGNSLKEITNTHDNTKSNAQDRFIGVKKLYELASRIKNIFTAANKDIKITYIADWSEYHGLQIDDQYWTHLDFLWNSSFIDFISINAYFPLTMHAQEEINDYKKIAEYWRKGEGYDYIFDKNGQEQKIIDSAKAWKNIEAWSKRFELKKDIWFTECGFFSIDAITNRPSFFYETNDINSLPPFSEGNSNLKAQYNAIKGTIEAWKNSKTVKKIFFNGWNLLPEYNTSNTNIISRYQQYYASSKDLNLNNKLGNITLGNILNSLASSIQYSNFNSNLSNQILGFAIQKNSYLANIIDDLSGIFNFYISEHDQTQTIENTNPINFKINENDIILDKKNQHKLIIKNFNALYGKIFFTHLNNNLESIVTESQIPNNNQNVQNITQNIILPSLEAQDIVNQKMENLLSENAIYEFTLGTYFYDLLSQSYKDIFHLEPGQKINLIINEKTFFMQIIDININNLHHAEIKAIKIDNVVQ